LVNILLVLALWEFKIKFDSKKTAAIVNNVWPEFISPLKILCDY